jgi:hypothetical protein
MRKLQKFAGVLGILLMIIFGSGVVFWESMGRNMYEYQDTIVLISSVKYGDVIEGKNLKIVKSEKSSLIANAIIDENQIVGKIANNYIPANNPIVPEFLTDKELVLNPDQYIFKVPTDWVKAIPSSVRRRDKVIFYEVEDDDKVINNQPNVDDKNRTEEQSKTTVNDEKLSINTYPTIDNKDESISSADKCIPVLNTVIAYVKDNANREVVTIGNLDRYDGSSQVSDVEIIVTGDQVEILKKSVLNGNKFLIMYQEK